MLNDGMDTCLKNVSRWLGYYLRIENYPGFVEPISGPDFAMKLESHAQIGLEILYDDHGNG